MLAWMFNRHKSKDTAASDNGASVKLRELADIVRAVAPDEFAAGSRAELRVNRIPRHPASLDGESGLGALEQAAAMAAHFDDAEHAVRPQEDDSEARMDVARRLRRHLANISPSERLDMVDEFVAAIARMSDCYRPQVAALIEQELDHTPYLTRQAALKLTREISAIGRVQAIDYVEMLSDADFLDILRGRGEFVVTAAVRAETEKRAAAEARLSRDRAEKGGLLTRFLSGDDGPKNVVALTPHLDRVQALDFASGDDHVLSGREKISRQAQRRIAHFIAASLFDTLVEERRLRAEVARALRQAVRQRIEKARFENRMPVEAVQTMILDELPEDAELVTQAGASQPMTIDQVVLDALSRDEDAMVVQALAHYAQLPQAVVSKIIDSGSARAITALAWRAGMTAPSAVVLQISSGVPEDNLERPVAGGRYNMSSADMDWYIDFFNELQPAGPRKRSNVTTSSETVPGRSGRKTDTRRHDPDGA
ncbi:MAG: DUF2336 domain-containing protein [Pseudomonadota bacterium]